MVLRAALQQLIGQCKDRSGAESEKDDE